MKRTPTLDAPASSVVGAAASPWACMRCGRGARLQLSRCPACAALHTFVATTPVERSEVHSREAQTARSLLSSGAPSRRSCGSAAWDEALGGGAVAPCSILIGGPPGVGKSRALLRIASDLSAPGAALYLSFEEPPERVARVARDVGADIDRLLLVRPESLDAAIDAIRSLRPPVVVWDSLHAVPGVRAKHAARSALRVGLTVGAVSLIVSHVAKDGSFADSEQIRHDVDVVISMKLGAKGRALLVTKNRFGPAPIRCDLGR